MSRISKNKMSRFIFCDFCAFSRLRKVIVVAVLLFGVCYGAERIQIDFFYEPGCHDCERIEQELFPEIEKRFGDTCVIQRKKGQGKRVRKKGQSFDFCVDADGSDG